MICIIDLGTSKVSSILIDDAEKMTVKAFSSVETQGIKKGSIINIGATSDSIADSIRDLEMQSGEKIKEVNVAFLANKFLVLIQMDLWSLGKKKSLL